MYIENSDQVPKYVTQSINEVTQIRIPYNTLSA